LRRTVNKPDRLEGSGVSAVNQDTGAGLAEARVTRARAIKLLGAVAGTGAFALLLPDEADARKRKRRRRRRRARVAPTTPTPITLNVAPGGGGVLNPSIDITNPSPDTPLTISEVRVIDSDGSVIDTAPLVGGPVTLRPRETATITPNLSGLTVTELLDADGLRLVDGRGLGITVIDEDGVQVGDIPVDVVDLR
jgi:hypothetical protein